jgi:MFS transporter, ACS family, D-galactonate transporter
MQTSAGTPANREKLSSALWPVLILLVFAAFINYVDRGNISIAAPLIKDDLHLSPNQLGRLLASFFWTYAVFQIVSGWLVDRFNVNWIIAFGFLVWSGATAVTGLVHGLVALVILRLVLGVGESVAYPSYSKILALHFPENHRGFANAAISAGASCGPAFGIFFGGMLVARFGWRPFFVVLGIACLLWLVPWIKWMPRGPALATPELSIMPPASPGLLEILRQPSAWGTCGGLFSLNYVSYFLMTWMPFYLVRERQFSMDQMAQTGGGAYLLAAISGMVAGHISDRLITAGAPTSRVRKTVMIVGMAVAAIALAACAAAGSVMAVICLSLAAAGYGICTSNLWAITQTLAGTKAAGRWTGVQNFLGNMAGIAAPQLTGLVVDRTGHFFWAFAIAAAVALLGVLFWLVVVGPVEPVKWQIE